MLIRITIALTMMTMLALFGLAGRWDYQEATHVYLPTQHEQEYYNANQ